MPEPSDPLERDIWPCWHIDGWESAGELSMQVAEGLTRGGAKDAYLSTVLGLDWTEVGVWKRHVLPVTRQQAWWDWGRTEQAWRQSPRDGALADADVARLRIEAALPILVPDDWNPGYLEGHATWRFVLRGTPGAVAYWVCGAAGSPPPRTTTGRDREAPYVTAGREADR